jgi:hypothetical protein
MIPTLESHAIVIPPAPSLGPADAAPNFDRLARAYRWMEWLTFGPFLGLCRSNYLPRLNLCRHALVLGDGDGRFNARLMRENPSIRVHALDGSHAMLAALTQACGPNAARLTTQHVDLLTWQPPPTPMPFYDLVVTHFFLDCLSGDEVLALARRIRPTLATGALWVISEFAVPKGWFGRLAAGMIVRALYLAFALLTGLRPRKLPDYASAMSAAGFMRVHRRPRLGGLLVSELWADESISSQDISG